MSITVNKIVSGGQTGADRAALDVAIEQGIDHGGWAPRGRWAEDGPLPPRYQLRETDSSQVAVRTEWNVRDAGATLIFGHGPLSGGTALTLIYAERLDKPSLYVDMEQQEEATAAAEIRVWLARIRPVTLNVAGPRASNDPLIYDAVLRVLRRVFDRK